MVRFLYIIISISLMITSCRGGSSNKKAGTPEDQKPVRLITVDPGHFHAALVQKSMYESVSQDVHVFAPEGEELKQHLGRINSYNSRKDSPTSWNEIVYSGTDYFEKMVTGQPGNVVILSGNNSKKAEYIFRSVNAGLNVLADKPMIIDPADFPKLEEAFRVASEKGILLFDIMTERYEISTILQKALSQKKEIFGELVKGTEREPALTKESVHHFAKNVSGVPLIRPAWFFDTRQQGEGIVDVTTHLVDLVQWECFPDKMLNKKDINIGKTRRWPVVISKEEFMRVTGLDDYPGFLGKDVKDGKLNVFANGEIIYQIMGVWAKVSVEWKYKAPEGGGDTHFSVMRGTRCDLVIRQTEKEKFVPELYVENIKGMSEDDFIAKLGQVLRKLPFDSLLVERVNERVLRINIPAKYRVGHEAHFSEVTAKFLDYLKVGKLPEWEVDAMITKYYTTTDALKLARGK